jgi:hypothetical protein
LESPSGSDFFAKFEVKICFTVCHSGDNNTGTKIEVILNNNIYLHEIIQNFNEL